MGMPEYHDGTFGPIKPIEEALKDLEGNPDAQARTKALHIGLFDELIQRAAKPIEGDPGPEPLAKILQLEFAQLRMDVNKIMIRLGIDDKNRVLPVKDI